MSLKTRIKALEARRKAGKASPPRQSWRATMAAMDAELASVEDSIARLAAEDAELLGRIGETAFAAVLAGRARETEFFEWGILQGRFPRRDDISPENEILVREMLTDLARAWQQDHIEAGTWPEVCERMTRLEADRGQSRNQ